MGGSRVSLTKAKIGGGFVKIEKKRPAERSEASLPHNAIQSQEMD
jgi:hypothetical protein